MTQTEYEQKRRECWEEFEREYLVGEVPWQPVGIYDAFSFAFSRAYALGKQAAKTAIQATPNLSESPTCSTPKYHKGDRVICGVVCDRKICEVEAYNVKTGEYTLRVIENGAIIHRSEQFISRNLSQNTATCDKQFDSILPESSRNRRRLHIAAMALQGILSNQSICNNLGRGETTAAGMFKCIAEAALSYADALIANSQKGGAK